MQNGYLSDGYWKPFTSSDDKFNNVHVRSGNEDSKSYPLHNWNENFDVVGNQWNDPSETLVSSMNYLHLIGPPLIKQTIPNNTNASNRQLISQKDANFSCNQTTPYSWNSTSQYPSGGNSKINHQPLQNCFAALPNASVASACFPRAITGQHAIHQSKEEWNDHMSSKFKYNESDIRLITCNSADMSCASSQPDMLFDAKSTRRSISFPRSYLTSVMSNGQSYLRSASNPEHDVYFSQHSKSRYAVNTIVFINMH